MYVFFSGFDKANTSNQVLHDVGNALYTEMSMSNAHYSPTDCPETATGHVYEVTTSAVVREGYPYEAPAPLGARNAGND